MPQKKKSISTISIEALASTQVQELETPISRALHGDLTPRHFSILKEIESGADAILAQFSGIQYEKAGHFADRGNGKVSYWDESRYHDGVLIEDFLAVLEKSAAKLMDASDQLPLDAQHRAARKLGILTGWLRVYQQSGRLDSNTVNTAKPYLETVALNNALNGLGMLVGSAGMLIAGLTHSDTFMEMSAFYTAVSMTAFFFWLSVHGYGIPEYWTRHDWKRSGRKKVQELEAKIRELRSTLCRELLIKG